MISVSAKEATMRTPERRENGSGADNAVATIWLIFYVLALGVAITSPFIADMTTLAAR